MNNHQILKKALKASTWSTLTSVASKAITPIAFIVLARLLTPKDYGMVAIATMVIAFCRIFWEAGLNKALIQSQENIREVANIVFYSNLVLGMIVFNILLVFAPQIATLFKEPHATAVIRVQSIVVVINSFCAVQNSLLQKELKFKPLFYVGLLGSALPGLVSIPAALLGLGYWALVYGTLVGSIVQLVLLWVVNPWRPSWSYDLVIAKRIVTFGLWSAGESFLAWGQSWLDSLIVATYLGTTELGLYRTGCMFVQSGFNLLLSPILPVLYSTMSLKSYDRNFISLSYEKVSRWMSAISLPAGLILFALQDPISAAVFGGKWKGVGLVIGIVALDNGIGWMLGANQELYRAIGKPKYSLLGALFFLPVFLLGCWISVKYGLLTFLITRICVSVLFSFAIQSIILYRTIQYTMNKFITNIYWVIFSACVCAIVAMYISKIHVENRYQLMITIASAITGVIVYVLLIISKKAYRFDIKSVLSGLKYR